MIEKLPRSAHGPVREPLQESIFLRIFGTSSRRGLTMPSQNTTGTNCTKPRPELSFEISTGSPEACRAAWTAPLTNPECCAEAMRGAVRPFCRSSCFSMCVSTCVRVFTQKDIVLLSSSGSDRHRRNGEREGNPSPWTSPLWKDGAAPSDSSRST